MGRPAKYGEGEILDRAMVQLWRRGWSQTSIRDLEETLDLKAPSIYRRFGSKEGLGAAVLDHYVEQVVRRRVGKHLSGDGDPLGNIATFLERSVTRGPTDADLWGCLLVTTAFEVDAPEADLRDAVTRGRAVIENGLRREVERAAVTGALAAGIDPHAAVDLLVLAMHGLMVLVRSGAPPEELQRRARSAVAVLRPDRPGAGTTV